MLSGALVEAVLAEALWELSIKPLYCGAYASLTTRFRQRPRIDAALKAAAQDIATAGKTGGVGEATWQSFFETADARTVLQDLFAFQMDTMAPSVSEIGLAFRFVWEEFVAASGVGGAEVNIDLVFDRLVANASMLLEAAVADGLLASEEATAIARHRAVEARLEVIASLASGADGGAQQRIAFDVFESALRLEVGARHATVELPSLLNRERVSLERLYVQPTLRPHSDLDPALTRETVPTEASVPSFVNTLYRGVVLGDPGAGKSTLAGKICHALAQPGVKGPAARPATPWLVQLRRLPRGDEGPTMSLLEYFEQWAETSYELEVPTGAFHWLLSRGRLLVIFDGLDELLDTSWRVDVRDKVESFCRRYSTTPVLVTSRLVGYDQAPLDAAEFATFRINAFDRPRVHQYALNWLAIRLPEEARDMHTRHATDFMRDSEVAGDLRSNPLLLGLLVSLHRGPGSIPNNLPDVYDGCASLLFSTWDKHRGILSPLPFPDQIRPALRELALWIFESPSLSGGVTRRQAIERTAAYLSQRRFGDRDRARVAAEEFIDFCRGRAWVFSDQGSTARGEDLFGFTHRTFLEFFAAEHLAYRNQSAGDLAAELMPKVVKEQWDVVALIALQIKARSYPDGADDVITACLTCLRPHTGRRLLAGVHFILRLLHAVIPSPAVTRELGTRLTVFGMREVHQKLGSSRSSETAGPVEAARIFSAMAGVGPEVAEELASGIAHAEHLLIRSGSEMRRRMGSELIFRSEELLAQDVGTRFWTAIAEATLRAHGELVRGAAASDLAVARDAYQSGFLGLDEILECHGLPGVFEEVQRSRGLYGPTPVQSIVKGLVHGGHRADAAIVDLEALGRFVRHQGLGRLRAGQAAVFAVLDDDFRALNKVRRASLGLDSDDARFGLWVTAAVAYEALGIMSLRSSGSTEGGQRLEKLTASLSGSRDPLLRSLAGILVLRGTQRTVPTMATDELSRLAVGAIAGRTIDEWCAWHQTILANG